MVHATLAVNIRATIKACIVPQTILIQWPKLELMKCLLWIENYTNVPLVVHTATEKFVAL